MDKDNVIFLPWLELNLVHALLELGDGDSGSDCVLWGEEDSYSELEIALGNRWRVRSIWRNQCLAAQHSPFVSWHSRSSQQWWKEGSGNLSPKPKLISEKVPLPQQRTTREKSRRTELGKEDVGKWNTAGKNPAKGQREWKWRLNGDGVLSSEGREWRRMSVEKYSV